MAGFSGDTSDEAVDEFIFVRDHGDADTAAKLGLPLGRIRVADLFERHLADSQALDL